MKKITIISIFIVILIPFSLQAGFSLKKAAKEISKPVEIVAKPVKELVREPKVPIEKHIVLCPDPPCLEKKDKDQTNKKP